MGMPHVFFDIVTKGNNSSSCWLPWMSKHVQNGFYLHVYRKEIGSSLSDLTNWKGRQSWKWQCCFQGIFLKDYDLCNCVCKDSAYVWLYFMNYKLKTCTWYNIGFDSNQNTLESFLEYGYYWSCLLFFRFW